MQTEQLSMRPHKHRESFHDSIMLLKSEPFGLDMQEMMMTMTETQFDELQEDSAMMVLPVLHSLSSAGGMSC